VGDSLGLGDPPDGIEEGAVGVGDGRSVAACAGVAAITASALRARLGKTRARAERMIPGKNIRTG
jgi:hypothetical protein